MDTVPQCPFNAPCPQGRHLYDVPVEYRDALAYVQARRKESSLVPRGKRWSYYNESSAMQDQMEEIEQALAKQAGVEPPYLIEYHEGWKYSCLTPSQIRLECEASKNGQPKG